MTCTPAVGQNRATVNRPTTQTGSSILGRTGGRYTRELGGALSTTQGMSTQQALQNGGNLNQQNFFGMARGIGGIGAPPLPQAFSVTGVGFSARAFNYPVDAHLAPPSTAMLAAHAGLHTTASGASGIGRSLSRSMPLMGLQPRRVDTSAQPYFVPEPQGTAFHRFFELTPSGTSPSAAVGDPGVGDAPTVAELIERGNDLQLVKLRQRALREFALATSEEVEDRAEALSAAQASLRTAMQLDRTDHVPPILLLHVAIAKRQTLMAANWLDKVLLREPEFFVNRPDVAVYFGDYQPPAVGTDPIDESDLGEANNQSAAAWGTSRFLTEQARAWVRLGDSVPANSGAAALQVYFAWILDDERRVRSTLSRMAPGEAHDQERLQMQRLSYALSAALR